MNDSKKDAAWTGAACLGVLLIAVGGLFFTSWIVMLLLGALASMTATPGLALGFWPVVVIVLLVEILGSLMFRSNRQ